MPECLMVGFCARRPNCHDLIVAPLIESGGGDTRVGGFSRFNERCEKFVCKRVFLRKYRKRRVINACSFKIRRQVECIFEYLKGAGIISARLRIRSLFKKDSLLSGR